MGKNIYFSFKRFALTILSFFSIFFAFPESYAEVEGVGRASCPDLSTLSFFGESFQATSGSRTAFCVNARNDDEAELACDNQESRRGGNFTAVNPGNPQYGQDWGAGNDLNRNSRGYYYCVPAISENRKANMCDRASAGEGFQLQWRRSGGSRDGNCMCSPGANGQNWGLECAAAAQAQTTSEDAPQQPPPPAVVISGNNDDVRPANVQENEFVRCVRTAAEAAATCKSNAEAAQRACNPEEARNSTRGQVGEVLGAAGGIYAQANANTGAQAECFRAGLIANGARVLLNPASDSCSNDIDGCNSTCGENKYDEYRTRCEQILVRTRQKTIADLLDGEGGEAVSAETAAVREHDANIREHYTDGNQICQAGRRSQDTLNTLMTGLGNALQQSMMCACQLSTSAVSGAAPTTPQQASANGCNQIPNPDECATNPALPNCNIYGSINVCTPGASYNAAACNCQMNPRATGCPGATTGDGNSSFAGTQIGAARPGDTVSFAGLSGGAGGRAGGIDLSGSEDPSTLELGENGINRSADALPQVGGGSSARGGAAGGAGGEVPPGMLPDGDAKSGLSGMLTNLTQRAGRFLGLNPRGNGNIRTKPGSNKSGDPNMGKFRPRGLASTGVGTKNMDIWRMMNMCVQGDTCKRNVNNYITGP